MQQINACPKCLGIKNSISLTGNAKRTILTLYCKCGYEVTKTVYKGNMTVEEKTNLMNILIQEWNGSQKMLA